MQGFSPGVLLLLRSTYSRRIGVIIVSGILCTSPVGVPAQEQREDEIVADLAGGRAIVHVAKDVIVFAAIDQPVERNSIPPRVINPDATHIAALFAPSECPTPAAPNPTRL